jgi:hypothetical protein
MVYRVAQNGAGEQGTVLWFVSTFSGARAAATPTTEVAAIKNAILEP